MFNEIFHYFLIAKSGYFDRKYYLETNPDVRKADMDSLWHFVKTGWKEGRNPSRNFQINYYLERYSDVNARKINPLVHFIRFGKSEGRETQRTVTEKKEDIDKSELNLYSYENWIKLYDTLEMTDRELIKTHIDGFVCDPLISLVMPVYNTPIKFLREAIESVLDQLYRNWELCIADDASTDPDVQKVLKEFQELDSRIKVMYRKNNGHISAASNSALSLCSGDYIGFLDHDDILREHALYMVVNEINKYPEADIIYSDEDFIDALGNRFSPYFKPDWSPDLFHAQNLITHFSVYRTNLINQVGGFREGYEGAQDWDLAMRISELIPASNIRHIPFVLYHWRAVEGSTALSSESKSYAKTAQYKTLSTHFIRTNKNVHITSVYKVFWRVRYLFLNNFPLVSILIPSKNNLELLQNCVESIRNKTLYPNYRILIIDNQSDNPEILNYYNEIQGLHNIKVISYDHPFNFSAINNFAVNEASGEVITFLNNDIEVISYDWLHEMVGHAIQPEIGAVGAMLYYLNDTIQHAGVILKGSEIAGHIYQGLPKDAGKKFLPQNFSAVTGACLVIEKKKFLELGGFNETDLPIAYNDIDFCLRLLEKGYRNLWTPYAELYHHESATRGYENTPQKKARFQKESNYMLKKWEKILYNDPAYNMNRNFYPTPNLYAFPPRGKKPWHKNQSGNNKTWE